MFKQICWQLFCVLTVIAMVASGGRMAAVAAEPIAVSARGAVLYEPQSGRVLYEQHAHVKRPMASTTKLMTALVAAEALPPDRRVVVSDEAVRVEGSSMGLQSGDVLTVTDLLKGLLLASGNDAANVLALAVSPSAEAFAVRMNEYAARIGMTHTRFVTPSGLDADGHGSTPYDMALLAAQVLKHPLLADICAMRTATVQVSGIACTLTNHNKLLASYDGAIGMKTGFTKAAGRCLVSAARREGVTLIAVTMDCPDDWQTHRDLLDFGFSLMTRMTLPLPALPLVTVFGGKTQQVALCTDPTSITVRKGEEAAVQTAVQCAPYLWAPVAAGERVGQIVYYINGDAVATVPLTAGKTVEPSETASRLQTGVRLFLQLWRQALT